MTPDAALVAADAAAAAEAPAPLSERLSERLNPIVVKEVPCVKPGCPPIETAIIAILRNEPPRSFKIQQPINQVTFDHVYDLIENPLPCC